MAFIRWKRNKSGLLRAQIVHSYRDGEGRPRQQVLAHLGAAAELAPEHLTALQAKHPELEFEKILQHPGAKAPPPTSDATGLSDEELWRKMDVLRKERGWTYRTMVDQLKAAGLPPIGAGVMFGLRLRATPLEWTYYMHLERSASRGEALPRVAPELLPYIRKVFTPPAP